MKHRIGFESKTEGENWLVDDEIARAPDDHFARGSWWYGVVADDEKTMLTLRLDVAPRRATFGADLTLHLNLGGAPTKNTVFGFPCHGDFGSSGLDAQHLLREFQTHLFRFDDPSGRFWNALEARFVEMSSMARRLHDAQATSDDWSTAEIHVAAEIADAERSAFGLDAVERACRETTYYEKECIRLGRAYGDLVTKPIEMHLWCPECGARHIDVGDFATKVHHTHSCQSCGLTWRPSVRNTVGVQFLPGFKNEEPAK